MSVGNLRDSGNKGNNFPYQLAELKLLDAIYNAIIAGSPASIPAGSILDTYFEADTNALTIGLYQVWRAANPTVKVIARTMMVDNTSIKSGLYIEYIP